MKQRSPRIEVICVGTELFTSRVNSHTVAIGRALARIGLSIAREHVIGDAPRIMRETFAEAWRRADIVLCAGGLGPTFDDFTRDVWARVTKHPLRFHPDLFSDISAKFRIRGIAMPPMNRRQAYVLKNARALPNPFGTAPGQLLRVGKKILVLLPGPTRELVPMLESAVIPELHASHPNFFVGQKTLLIFGSGESKIDQIVRPWVARHQRQRGCEIEHGILASNAIISVKFKVTGRQQKVVRTVCDELSAQARKLLRGLTFGEDDDTLDGIAVRLLKEQKKTVAIAESCTGGLIAKTLTDTAGAADIFEEGLVTYSNESKARRVSVSQKTLITHGAVSEQTAREMALGARRTSRADIGLSVTGIAGPTGGSPEKPVGLVWIGLADEKGVAAHEFHFSGDRAMIRQRAAQNAFNLLRLKLLDGR
jgi:nicotinamide-nucleotide amidase